MKLIDDFKNFYAKRQLKKELNSKLRSRKMVDFDEARHVGVVYNITDEENYKVIFNFLKSLRNEQRTVVALGFINEKRLPSYLNQSIYNSIIYQKDLNWYHKPVNPHVNNFFKENFDLFMNISLVDQYPLSYISALSNAYMKVGRYNERFTDCFDLMIKVPDDISQQAFLEEMTRIIRMLNKPAQNE